MAVWMPGGTHIPEQEKTTLMNQTTRLSLLALLLLCTGSVYSQAYFEGNVKDALTRKSLNNVKIMVINNMDTSWFKVDETGNFNITTKEGRNRIYAVGEGLVTELNSIEAAKGSKNRVDISMVRTAEVESGGEKRKAHKTHFTETAPAGAAATSYMWGFSGGSGAARGGDLDAKSVFIYDGVAERKAGLSRTAGTGGRLTAGEINDFAKWTQWNDLNAGEFAKHSGHWHMQTGKRYGVQLVNQNGTPVVDAKVSLSNNGKVIWESRTDNTGKAELWAFLFAGETGDSKNMKIGVEAYNQTLFFDNPQEFYQNGMNFYKITGPCAMSDQLDIAFVVDATGSMGDEINYLQDDLDTLIKIVSRTNSHINLRMGSVFYRDRGDSYVTRVSPFSSNTSIADNFILDQGAGEGGDFPEAVDSALSDALTKLDWSSTARARILFLFLDAPAHPEMETQVKLQRYMKLAAAKGIRIVPVACSGADKSTEFLMRSMALATNGKYIFLTDHSGLGGGHIAPSTDFYKVETLLEVLSRTAREFSTVPECSNELPVTVITATDTIRIAESPLGKKDSLISALSKDSSIRKKDSLALGSDTSQRVRDSLAAARERKPVTGLVKFYPNPTSGALHVVIEEDIPEFYIADIGGKLLQRYTCKRGDHLVIHLEQYSAGIYYIKYPTPRGWLAERIVLRY
ncbi:MAG: VWA domain-containing protein [Bacteroidetes bacterium]|nr:VWA domain-containing protein [Bacteroidota bacterium]